MKSSRMSELVQSSFTISGSKSVWIFSCIGLESALHYRKRGSASYIVREWLLWVVEREREMPVTSFDITLKSRVIMHMITSTSRWPYTSTRSAAEPVECSSACACKDKELGAWALEQQGRVRLMNDDREGEALRSLVSLPWITEQHFVGMLQARRIDQVDVYFLFKWQRFCLREQLG